MRKFEVELGTLDPFPDQDLEGVRSVLSDHCEIFPKIRKCQVLVGLDSERNQWDGSVILDALNLRMADPLIFFVLTSRDIYVSPYRRVFGYASPKERIGIVSTHGFHKANLPLRTSKVILHETGHLTGLKHCRYQDCVMNSVSTTIELDARGASFCSKCLRSISVGGN